MLIIVRCDSDLTVELTVDRSTTIAYIKNVLREQLSEKKIIQDCIRYKNNYIPETTTIENLSLTDNAELTYEYLDAEKSAVQFHGHRGYDIISTKETILPMTISISAPTMIDESMRAPIDMTICVDNSGSMSNIIDLVKTSLRFLISQLGPNDRFSIVKFSDTVDIILKLTYMTLGGRERANLAVDNLNPDGGTALCQGITTAINIMQKREPRKNIDNESTPISSILIFTDGEANIGPQTNDEIKSALVNKIRTTDDFSIYTFGFGTDHNASLLQSISVFGKGMYSYIENPNMISGSLVNCVAGLMSVAAGDIHIDIESCDGSTFIDTSSSQPQMHYIDSSHIEIKVPDIQSGEKKSFLIEVKVPQHQSSLRMVDTANEKVSQILRMSMICSNTLLRTKDHTTKIISVSRSDAADIKENLNSEVSKNINRILLISTMERIKYMTKYGNIIGARIAAMDAIQTIEKSVSGNTLYCKNLVQDLQAVLNTLKNNSSYVSTGLFLISSSTQSHQYQRSSNPSQLRSSNSSLSSAYITSFSQKMQSESYIYSTSSQNTSSASHNESNIIPLPQMLFRRNSLNSIEPIIDQYLKC